MITIKDNINTLTPDQTQTLKVKSLAYPFDIYVMIGSSGSRAEFQAEVSSMVTGLKVLSIGVDPAHHFTFVRGSADLHLPDGPEVASTGNAFFKRADLVGGIDAIAAKSKELSARTEIVESATGAPIIVHEDPMASGWWWGLGGIGAVIAVVSVWVWLSRRADRKRLEAERERYSGLNAELNNELGDVKIAKAELGDETFERKPYAKNLTRRWAPPPSSAPLIIQQQPVIVQDDSLLTGMVIGEIMSQPSVTIIEAPARSYSSYSPPEPSSSSSSWSDSSSSSSYDSSSSSSDWSGGGDSGGGGGGSDW